jgi:hypothetical protein
VSLLAAFLSANCAQHKPKNIGINYLIFNYKQDNNLLFREMLGRERFSHQYAALLQG